MCCGRHVTVEEVMIVSKKSGLTWLKGVVRRKLFERLYSPALEAQGQFFISGADYVGQEVVIRGGRYDPDNLDALALLFSKYSLGNGIAIDVGANIGNHSRFFVSCFDRVICVEPNPVVALILDANLRLTGRSNWTLVRAALSDTEGVCDVEIVDEGNLGSTMIRKAERGSGRIPVFTGDSLLSEPSYAGKKVEFVKVDVEGGEVGVLRGMRQMLTRDTPLIAIECFKQDAWHTMHALLVDCGYSDFLVLDKQPQGRSWGVRTRKLVFGTQVRLEAMTDEWPPKGYDMIVCLAA